MKKQNIFSQWADSLPSMKVRIVSIAILLGSLLGLLTFAYYTTLREAVQIEYNANEKVIYSNKKENYPSDGWVLDSSFNEEDYIAMSTFGYCQRIGFVEFSKNSYNVKEDIPYILQEIVPNIKERLGNRENGVSLEGVLEFDEYKLKLSFCIRDASSSKEAEEMFEESFDVVNEDFEELFEKRCKDLELQ